MGQVTHWVHKISWTSLVVAGICAGAWISGMDILASAIKDKQMAITVQITNEGNKPVVKAFRIGPDGHLIPVK
jgi:putative intracellular protease/amidase